jgi:hypothetical protein
MITNAFNDSGSTRVTNAETFPDYSTKEEIT